MLCAMYTMDSSRSDDKRDPLIFPCHQLLFSHFNNVFSWNFSFLSKSFKVTFFAICDGTWDGLKNILKSLTKNFLTWVLASGNQGWQQYAKGPFPHSHLWFSTLVPFQIRSNEVSLRKTCTQIELIPNTIRWIILYGSIWDRYVAG